MNTKQEINYAATFTTALPYFHTLLQGFQKFQIIAMIGVKVLFLISEEQMKAFTCQRKMFDN
ncbi:MAG: hypothetical protein WC799_06800 [Desulfobacteraceae bacterium]